MGTNAGIPVKAGRLSTPVYSFNGLAAPVASDGDAFRINNSAQASVLPTGPGGISTKPSTSVYRSPIANHYNVATIRKVEPSVHLDNMHVFHPNAKPQVQPQTKSILPMQKVRPVVHMAFGGSPNFASDSAFHPINQPRPIPKFKSETPTEKIAKNIPGINTHNNLWYGTNQSFYNGQQQIGSDRIGRGRWHVTKQGAV